eukprot:1137333-Pelagomonas_calceolata.AAC.2
MSPCTTFTGVGCKRMMYAHTGGYIASWALSKTHGRRHAWSPSRSLQAGSHSLLAAKTMLYVIERHGPIS